MTAYRTSTTNASNAVSATGAHGSAVSITVNGEAHTSGAAAVWKPGDNMVRVTARNGGSERVYTVTVTKAEG